MDNERYAIENHRETGATCGSKSALIDGLAATTIVKQTHQIMVGRLKSGNIFIQVDCVNVAVAPNMVDDLIAALLMAKGG